jgi:hypothetical protein
MARFYLFIPKASLVELTPDQCRDLRAAGAVAIPAEIHTSTPLQRTILAVLEEYHIAFPDLAWLAGEIAVAVEGGREGRIRRGMSEEVLEDWEKEAED